MEEAEGSKKKSTHSNTGRIGNRPYWVLSLSIIIRAIHQIGAAVFLTVFLLTELSKVPKFYVVLVFSSGLILIFTEWLRHRQIFREISGVVTFLKLGLLGLAFHGVLPTTETVLLAFFVASVGAHAPKLVRHRLLF